MMNKDTARQYQRKMIQQVSLNLNRKTDEDIIRWLELHDNKQGYIKSLIRADIAKTRR